MVKSFCGGNFGLSPKLPPHLLPSMANPTETFFAIKDDY